MLASLSIGIVDEHFERSRMLEDVLFSLDVKNTHLIRSINALKNLVPTTFFDVIFLQHSIDNYHNHYDAINRLISEKLISSSTRLIFLSSSDISFDYTCEYPFHTCRVINISYSTAMVKQELEQHYLQKTEFSTPYKFIDAEQYKAALLNLKALRKTDYPNFLKKTRNQILVNLLIELGQYAIAKKLLIPLAKKKIEWASWCLFTINYELKLFADCEQFLEQIHIQQSYPNRVLYWQIYLAFLKNNCNTLTSKILSLNLETLTPMMFRLCVYILSINNEPQLVTELIQKRRIKHISNTLHLAFIDFTEAKLIVLQMLTNNNDAQLKQAKTLLSSASKHPEISQTAEFNAFLLSCAVSSEQKSTAKSKLAVLNTSKVSDSIELIVIALLNTKFGNDDVSFELLSKAHLLITKQFKNCHHILSGIMHKRVFEHSFTKKTCKIRAYEKMGRQLFTNGNYTSALKLYSHAFIQGLSSEEINEKVNQCAQLSGINERYYQNMIEDFVS